MESARETGLELPMATLISQLYQAMDEDAEFRSKDFGAITKWIASENNDK